MKKSNEIFERLRKKYDLRYRKLAKETHTSPSLWNNIVKEDRLFNPDTATRFIQTYKDITKEEATAFLNVLFKERLLYYLERDGWANGHETPEIQKIIKLLKEWTPEKGDPIRYIMSTNGKDIGMKNACNYNTINSVLDKSDNGILNLSVRGDSPRSHGQHTSATFLNDFATLGKLAKKKWVS